MKHFFIFFLYLGVFSFLTVDLFAQVNWENSIIDPNANLDCVYFVNADTGFVGTQDGNLFITHDRGTTWTKQNICSTRITNIHFINPEKGFIITPQVGGVYETTNGGITWYQSQKLNQNLLSYPVSIDFFDTLRGVILYYLDTQDSIALTMDGGLTWSKKKAFNDISITPSIIRHIGPTNIIIVGFGNTPLETYATLSVSNDLGSNWRDTIIHPPHGQTGLAINDIQFSSVKNGLFAGNGGTIYYTDDSSTLWMEKTYTKTTVYKGVSAVDSATSYLVGLEGNIVFSNNAGNTWTKLQSFTNSNLNDIQFIDDSNGYVVGNAGVFLRSIVSKNTVNNRDISTIIRVTSTHSRGSDILIDLICKKESLIDVRIFDELGRNQSSTSNQRLPIGRSQITMKTNSDNAHLLFLSIRDEDNRITRLKVRAF